MSDETEAPPPCPRCQRTDGRMPPCAGCQTRYHQSCFRQAGCALETCPMHEVRGQVVWPQKGRLATLARWTWMLAAAHVAAAAIREPGARELPDDIFGMMLFGSLALACAVTGLAYVRDTFRPYARCIAPEVQGRALGFLGLACLLPPLPPGSGLVRLAGGALLFLGAATAATRGNRETHQPVRFVSARLVEVMLALGVLLVLAAIAVPNFGHSHTRANTRACYANQKTIVGAIEMYNLDKNTKLDRLNPYVFHLLLSGGYLQSLPQDPGSGPGTAGHYHPVDVGNGITCEVHGMIQTPEPARR